VLFLPRTVFIYKYIISVNITSFWSQKCTIGNIYFPQSKWKEARLVAFDELSQWLRFHNRKNVPTVLVGDFNMSLKKIKTYISNNFPNWYIAPLYGNQFTYAKGTRSSCIDHSSIMRLWHSILIKPWFVLRFRVFLIINLFYFLATKF